MTESILIAGFGGQGVLFTGKVLAYTGLNANKEVSWLPSYGPEMRGGTANCSVMISDNSIGSPIVSNPTMLIAMNLPSLNKYEEETVSGGYVFFDNSLISREVERKDVKAFGIPATKLASENGMDGLANIIILGKVLKESNLFSLEDIKNAMAKMIPAKKVGMLEKNMKAIEIGYNY